MDEECKSFPKLKLNSNPKSFDNLFENWYSVVQKKLNSSSVSTTKQMSMDLVVTPIRRNG